MRVAARASSKQEEMVISQVVTGSSLKGQEQELARRAESRGGQEEEVLITRVEEVNASRLVTNLIGVTQCLVFIFLQGFLFGWSDTVPR